ncbi:MAG TPA: APC family permease [Gemmatimonadota bacterium]
MSSISTAADSPAEGAIPRTGFKRGLGLFDSAALVAGSMIGSGIFLVTPGMARDIGSPGWLLVAWVATGVLIMAAVVSYGELPAMMPGAGGGYVYLREAFSPLVGFLYGWSVFLVTQTGSIAALGVAFARAAGVLFPGVAEDRYLIPPLHVSEHYALSLSTAQLVALLSIALLTWTNIRGLDYGKRVQNLFSTTNVLALLGLIVACLVLGRSEAAVESNFTNLWTPRDPQPLAPGLTAATAYGLLAALCVAQVGSFFSSIGWENLPMMGDEVKDPRRNLPLGLVLGAGLVSILYLLANLGYLSTLTFDELRSVPGDQVASAALESVWPGVGALLIAGAIMASTFGCNNASILGGARTYWAMARDGLFFEGAGRLNGARVPGWGLALQGVWSAALVLPRTFDPATGAYGNLYSNLLDYVISILLIFSYVLPVLGIFRLRRTRPDAERPYRAFGYPVVPAFFVAGSCLIVLMLLLYRPYTTWPGAVIVLLGVPVYLWRKARPGMSE